MYNSRKHSSLSLARSLKWIMEDVQDISQGVSLWMDYDVAYETKWLKSDAHAANVSFE